MTTAEPPVLLVPHHRAKIREAAVAKLKRVTLAHSRVFGHRLRPVADTLLPIVVVSTLSETVESELSQEPRWLERRCELMVDVITPGDTEFEDLVDVMAQQVETALMHDPTLGGVIDDLTYKSSKTELVSGEGGRILAGTKILFDADYTTDESAQDLPVDLETAGVVWDLKQPQDSGEPEKESEVELDPAP